MNKLTFSIAYFLCAILTTLMFHSWLAAEHNEVIAYSDFKRLAHDGKVVSAEISERAITVDVDLTGIDEQHFPALGDGLRHAAGNLRQRIRQFIVDLRGTGVDAQRCLILRDRVRKPAHLLEDVSQV